MTSELSQNFISRTPRDRTDAEYVEWRRLGSLFGLITLWCVKIFLVGLVFLLLCLALNHFWPMHLFKEGIFYGTIMMGLGGGGTFVGGIIGLNYPGPPDLPT